MKEQIQQAISEGRTEEALQLLAAANGDAVLLQARYNQGKKQYSMGLIEFSEWSRVQNQINYAALEMAEKVKASMSSSSMPPPSKHPDSKSTPTPTTSSVFISYNHGDAPVARQVATYLENKGFDVILDQDDMQAGRAIMEFIQESIKNANAVISIVSSKSLQSGWVGQESIASMYAVWLTDNKKFIPVSLDSVAFDAKFQIMALRNIEAKMKEMDSDIAEIRGLGSDARDLEEDRKRLFDLQKNFSTTIQRLKSVLMTDISDPNFESGMAKVLKALNG